MFLKDIKMFDPLVVPYVVKAMDEEIICYDILDPTMKQSWHKYQLEDLMQVHWQVLPLETW